MKIQRAARKGDATKLFMSFEVQNLKDSKILQLRATTILVKRFVDLW
jgi:hypothetical protein